MCQWLRWILIICLHLARTKRGTWADSGYSLFSQQQWTTRYRFRWPSARETESEEEVKEYSSKTKTRVSWEIKHLPLQNVVAEFWGTVSGPSASSVINRSDANRRGHSGEKRDFKYFLLIDLDFNWHPQGSSIDQSGILTKRDFLQLLSANRGPATNQRSIVYFIFGVRGEETRLSFCWHFVFRWCPCLEQLLSMLSRDEDNGMARER